MEIKYYAAFELKDVSKWKHCPICGQEILEVYPGDYFGHIACFNDDEECSLDFYVITEDEESVHLGRDEYRKMFGG